MFMEYTLELTVDS